MKVAYLVNQYPKISHSFIRREIAALERLGIVVERISIRRWEAPLADAADRAETARTRVLLDVGAVGLLADALRVAAASPRLLARALWRTVKLGARSDTGMLRHLAYLAEACVLLRWCREWQIDHLHAHFGTNPAAVAMLCRALGGPSYSFTVHGPEEFERAEHLGLSEKIAHARFVVAVSEFGRRQLEAWYHEGRPLSDSPACAEASADRPPFAKNANRGEDPYKGPPIHVVHCGVDEEFLDHPPSPIPTAPRLVCVGRLCEQKAQLGLIDAAQELAADGEAFELVLVGDGPLREPIAARIAELGLANHVTLKGWASNAEVREQLLAARALVLPSRAEGLPVVLMEALALHRPVITTAVAGIPELVEDGVCGWLLPPGEITALAAAMRAALHASPDRLAEMGRAGAALVRARHDISIEAKHLSELFRDADR